MNLLDALARAVRAGDLQSTARSADPSGAPSTLQQSFTKPVLQLSRLPSSLHPSSYRNARSDANPGGDLRSLHAFRQLVDPLPTFGRYYMPSAESAERTYGQIVEGAATRAGSSFVQRVVADAKKQFNDECFAHMDGTPGSWRAVYAVPEDWHDTAQPGRYRELELALDGPDGSLDSDFSVLGAAQPLTLSSGVSSVRSCPVDERSRIHGVRMKYLLVQLRRPWLHPTLFELGDWYLSRQPAGIVSSGQLAQNAGIFPLLPTAVLLATDVRVEADWSRRDRDWLEAAGARRAGTFVGPLALEPAAGDDLQVVGWISALTPYAPRATDLRTGSITLQNDGAFVARCELTWQLEGRSARASSGNLPALSAKTLTIPAGACEVVVTIELMTFPPPFETWRSVRSYRFDSPVSKRFSLSGTTVSAHLSELSDR